MAVSYICGSVVNIITNEFEYMCIVLVNMEDYEIFMVHFTFIDITLEIQKRSYVCYSIEWLSIILEYTNAI